MRTRTLLAMRNEARALADTVNDPHVSDAQATLWINQGIADLWRQLVHHDPDRYVIRTTLATTTGTLSYSLTVTAPDLMAIRRVDLIRGTLRIPIEPFSIQEPPYLSQDSRGGGGTRYRLMGGGIAGAATALYFDPDPGTNTYALWYIQAPQTLSADGDTFDGIAGLEDYVVAFTALRMQIRQETDPSAVMAEMSRIASSIGATAAHRDVGRAPRIADVRPRGMRY